MNIKNISPFLSLQFLSPEQHQQMQNYSKIEYLQAQIVKVLGCPFADVKEGFYAAIYDKATRIIEFSNSELVFAMLEDAEILAQEGFRLSDIKQTILTHEYIRDNPIDVRFGWPIPRKILWTIRDDHAAERLAQATRLSGVSCNDMLAAIERFNKACEAAEQCACTGRKPALSNFGGNITASRRVFGV